MVEEALLILATMVSESPCSTYLVALKMNAAHRIPFKAAMSSTIGIAGSYDPALLIP